MMKRFALLLAALFVASMVLIAPVFASGSNGDDNGNANHNEKVCVLLNNGGDDNNGGDENNRGDKDYKWVSEHKWDSEHGNHHGDKVVKDKFCKDNNGDHENDNGDHNGNANNDNGDHNGNANNDDDNGNANNDEDGS